MQTVRYCTEVSYDQKQSQRGGEGRGCPSTEPHCSLNAHRWNSMADITAVLGFFKLHRQKINGVCVTMSELVLFDRHVCCD